jgi:hypothetical protein
MHRDIGNVITRYVLLTETFAGKPIISDDYQYQNIHLSSRTFSAKKMCTKLRCDLLAYEIVENNLSPSVSSPFCITGESGYF